jgi:peptidoglycan/LPS O-acetylase OafA/YrhL
VKYNPALDGLRAVAVLMVMAYHVGTPFTSEGYLGVDVFFVLSGYLITTILRREQEAGGIRLGAFYMRRLRRLYPTLCILVGLLLAVGWADALGAGKVLLYVSDYAPFFGGIPGSLSHTWSLAVEEHYYLVWPLALPFVMRLKHPMRVMLVSYALVTLWALLALKVAPAYSNVRFDGRLSGLVLGSALAFAPTLRIPLLLLGVATALVGLGIPADVAGFSPGDRLFTEAATACLIVLSTHTVLPWLTRPVLTYIGRISYGLYLFHAPIVFALSEAMPWQGRLGIALLATGALAALSYHTVEAWFRSGHNRLDARPDAAGVGLVEHQRVEV